MLGKRCVGLLFPAFLALESPKYRAVTAACGPGRPGSALSQCTWAASHHFQTDTQHILQRGSIHATTAVRLLKYLL